MKGSIQIPQLYYCGLFNPAVEAKLVGKIISTDQHRLGWLIFYSVAKTYKLVAARNSVQNATDRFF